MAIAWTLALSELRAYAEPSPETSSAASRPRPTFRLDYRLLDNRSVSYCPTKDTVRGLLNRLFGYEAIDDNAGPGIGIDVTSSEKPPHYEVLSHLLRDDQLPITTSEQYQHSTSTYSCFLAVYRASVTAYFQSKDRLDQLKAPPEPEPQMVVVTPVVRREAPTPTPPPTPSITVTLPSSAPAWRPPAGFMLTAGPNLSVGLTPTPSIGGLIGVSYRSGAWSGGLEARVEHDLVPAYLQQLSIDSLYAGAVLVAPCVHESIFSGCFVLEGGGYSFSTFLSEPIGGRFTSLAVGLRANLEHRMSEHLLVRGFIQLSGLPLSPFLFVKRPENHVWDSGPGFGTVGITLVTVP